MNKKNIGANISITIGVLILLSAANVLTKPDAINPFYSTIPLSFVLIFGGTACKRAKLERSKKNIILENIYLALACFLSLEQVNLEIIALHPLPYIALMWLAVAYIIIKIKNHKSP
jgi:hypothetical protein